MRLRHARFSVGVAGWRCLPRMTQAALSVGLTFVALPGLVAWVAVLVWLCRCRLAQHVAQRDVPLHGGFAGLFFYHALGFCLASVRGTPLSFTLVRQAKLVVSFRVKVPDGKTKDCLHKV